MFRVYIEPACKLIEIIIVDDCSRDKSIEIARFIVAKYSNAHVKILVHDKNEGCQQLEIQV